MKNKLMTVVIIIGLLIQHDNSFAGGAGDPNVDHTFNYQGELKNGNTVLNGLYDMRIEAYTTDSGPGTIGNLFERIKIPVIDGIFTINDVDLGDINDGLVVYLQISVRENDIGASYEALLPRLKIKSVPYANQLISGNAQAGQVLTFVAGEWIANDLPAMPGVSPWVVTGSKINYDAGKVGIGIGAEPHVYHLQVKGINSLTASFDGPESNNVVFRENGQLRGILGSGANFAADDFAISTPVAGIGKIHLAPQVSPVLTVAPSGYVGIGITSPTSPLHVKTSEILSAQFDGGANSLVSFLEEGVSKGFVGSGSNVAGNDFSMGSTIGDLHLISGLLNTPSLSITNDGDVGINTITPFADLHVEGTVDGDLFRVRIDATTKLRVTDNGGTGIGTLATPPANGLIVGGDAKQSVNSNGMMKYMVSVNNCGSANVSIAKSYNGVDNGIITPQNDVSGNGTCEILFTQNISNRYIMAHVTSGIAATGTSVSCAHLGNNGVSCVVFNDTGIETPGQIDVLIY